MEITDFKQAHEVLAKFIPKVPMTQGDYKLDRIQKLMKLLGDPQNSYKTIHIAGTSGKTSTAYFVAALLKESEQKVGLTVSPHVDEVNERIQINLKPLPENEFCKELTKFLSIVEGFNLSPTYFEVLVAFAFWEFAQQKVDYAVIEVGLGGLLDGTNVIDRPDKVSVITDIGFDHTKILGNNLKSIATQKAGIILPGSHVFSYTQTDEVSDVIRTVAAQKQAVLHEFLAAEPDAVVRDLPAFQKRNWYLAEQVVSYILKRDKLSPLTEENLKKSTTIYIPARMEVINYKAKKLILDGSHNQQKLNTLTTAIRDWYPNQKVAVLVGLLEEKDNELHDALLEITKIANFIITTSFFAGQDIPRDPMDPEHMKSLFAQLGFSEVESIAQPEHALAALLERPEEILLVTGSFYLLNHVRPIIFTHLH